MLVTTKTPAPSRRDIFHVEHCQCLNVRTILYVYADPLPPGFSGIMRLAHDSRQNLGPQGVAGKILELSRSQTHYWCRPSGTRSLSRRYPGLTPWANMCRPCGAGVWWLNLIACPAIQFHPDLSDPTTLTFALPLRPSIESNVCCPRSKLQAGSCRS
jgi:hypothetical protein